MTKAILPLSVVVLFLGLGAPADAGTSDPAECVNAIAEYFDLAPGTDTDLQGIDSGAGKCGLSITVLPNREGGVDAVRLLLNSQTVGWITADFPGDDTSEKVTVKACEVSDVGLYVKYSTKDRYGWKKRRRPELAVVEQADGSLEVTLSQEIGGLFTTDFEASATCRF